MASAQEIGRVHDCKKFAVEVLLEPPLRIAEQELRRRLGLVVFGEDRYYGPQGGSRTGLQVTEEARLGDISQILRITTFDARENGDPEATCDRAVGALTTFVTAMAEGDAEALKPFVYENN